MPKASIPHNAPSWLIADYIHLYHGNAALLTESLEGSQRFAALILSAIATEQLMDQAGEVGQTGATASAMEDTTIDALVTVVECGSAYP